MFGYIEGVVVGLCLATFDLWRWNRSYLSVLQGNLVRVAIAGAIITAGSIAAVVLHRRRSKLVAALRARRETASKVVFVLALALGFGAWFIRPLVQKAHAGPVAIVGLVQRIESISTDTTRRYSELSMRWISWYLGPITLTLGLVGAATVAAMFVRGSLRAPAATVALMLAPPALIYIWQPSVTPDQVWAARRFLPAVLPGLILLAFGLLCAVARDRSRPFLAERRFSVVALALVAAAFPLYSIRNLTQMTEQRGLFVMITDACKQIGPKGAVVMLQESLPPQSNAYLNDPQTLRSFCDVPVVVALGTPRAPKLQLLADQWRAKGHHLVLVSEYPEAILRVFPHAQVHPTLVGEESHQLQPRLLGPPVRYAPAGFRSGAATQLMIAEVPGTPRARGPAG